MARKKKSSETGEETAKTPAGLPSPPYSARVGGNKYVAYVHKRVEDEVAPRVIVTSFLSLFAAKWFVDRLIGEDDWAIEPWKYNALDLKLTTASNITIRMAGDQIREVMDYEFSSLAEREWKDVPLAKSIAYLKWGKWEHKAANDDVGDVPTTPEQLCEKRLTQKELKAQRREEKNKKREADPAKAPRPKIDKTGMISAGDLAEQMGILPRDFRAALRKLKMEKPEGGWSWPEDQADAIKKQVKGALK